MNRACLQSGTRWLRVGFEGRLGLVGPTIVPGQTACFTCYGLRRAMHDSWDEFQAHRQKALRDGDPHEGAIEALTSIVAGQAALEAARLLTGFAPPATFGRFYTFEAGTPMVARSRRPARPALPRLWTQAIAARPRTCARERSEK